MSTTPLDTQNTDDDPQQHLGCYVFTPATSNEAQRPPKRRRTIGNKGGKQKSKGTTRSSAVGDVHEDELLFPQLFNGKESQQAAKLRWESYNKLWEEQEKRTNDILSSVNEKMLVEVSGFVRGVTSEGYDGMLPTALILVGPNIASHISLFNQLANRIQTEERVGPVVVLSSKDATNLKGFLKKLIKDTTQEDEGLDDENDAPTSAEKTQTIKPLNYDLQILQDWCKERKNMKITIAIQDTEAFDSGMLSDLISLLNAYLDRIPFILLLGVATSIEIFHEKLPKSIIRLMRGEKFDVERAEECLSRVFNDATMGTQSALRLGPSLSDFLLRWQRDHTQSIQAFVAALKYAYMSHFYANPLSIFLAFLKDPEGLGDILEPGHLESVRNLPSFRSYVEAKLEEKDTQAVRNLLDDDEYLKSVIATSCQTCQSYSQNLAQALETLEVARSCMANQTNKVSRHELYPKALLGELDNSPIVREFLLAMKKMTSTKLMNVMDKITALDIDYLKEKLVPLQQDIIDLIEGSRKKNLSSEFDLSVADTVRATVVSKRVQLSEKKSALTKEETEYSRIIQQVHDILQEYFSLHLKGLDAVLLHEVFFYDLLSPHRDVFAPRPRYATERALSRPQDYLGCHCCRGGESGDGDEEPESENYILPSMPPTSILYKLYLESGPLINTFDLWSAFWSILGDANVGQEGKSEGGMDQATAQALFYRGLAELTFLGFVKETKRKTDHVAKLAWKGL